jgi:hypothetical protein
LKVHFERLILAHNAGQKETPATPDISYPSHMATYGWKERYDTVAIANALYSTENVQHLGALGGSMGAAIALQSAAVVSMWGRL